MKAYIRRDETGKCVHIYEKGDIPKPEGYEEIEIDSLEIEKAHSGIYLNTYKFDKIKEKTKELLFKHNYIFGLSSGWQQDFEFKEWFESLISFQNSFEGQTITEEEITFPTDPRGDTVTLKF